MQLLPGLLLLCVPGVLALSGPSTVTGTVGGSLSVQCRYQEEYKAFNKYWCKQPCLPFFSETVETSGPEGEARSGRVSIRDHPRSLTFTVTLENLTVDDAGKYRCGISLLLQEDGLSGFLPDPFFQVQVFVSPDPHRSLAEESAGLGTRTTSSPSASTTAATGKSSVRKPGSPSQGLGSLLSSSHFLLLVFLKVPVFLSILSAVLWVHRPQCTTCGKTRPNQDNLQLSLPTDVLSRVTATQNREGTSDPDSAF